MVFAAGDLSDPHGTHRMCLEAALAALERLRRPSGRARRSVALPRRLAGVAAGADRHGRAAVSPDELQHKRYAIFRHQSQKDRAMFPGPYDSREFWQRAEDRNMRHRRHYDKLGLPEYHALEAFVEHK